jgi:hypothetical protein
MQNLDEFVRVYDDHLPADLCDLVVEKFEASKQHHVHSPLVPHRVFTELNMMVAPGWADVTSQMMGFVNDGVRRYIADTRVSRVVWPDRYGFEQFRIKRYQANGQDQFDWHVDVQNHASARRFLVFFWYLCDVEDGGHTEFEWGRSVEPRRGRLLVFPPTWQFPHRGAPVVRGTKYIVGGYLHYL